MSAGSLEGLQGAKELPALAGFSGRYTEDLEKLLPSEGSGSYNNSNGLERSQGEEALLQNIQGADAATSSGQRTPGSTQVGK